MPSFTFRFHRFMLSAVLVGGLASGFASSSRAAISIYTTAAAFEATIPNLNTTGSYLNNFSGATGGAQTNYTASGNGFSYTATQSGATPQTTVIIGSNPLLRSAGGDLILTAAGGSYNAIGGNFLQSNAIGSTNGTGNVTVTVVNSGGETQSVTFLTSSSFRGFVSTTPITTVTVSGFSGGSYHAVDNLRVGLGIAPTAAAPEPGTLALLTLGGLGMVGIVIRKRRAN